jgi:DNA adenine methylase
VVRTLRNILRYPGGKVKVCNKIIDFRPKFFKEYREPFLGGGSIFLYIKQIINPEAIFILNDVNYDLICFWKKLRDDPERMINKIYYYKKNYKNGKELYHNLLHNNYVDDFERGIRFFILNRISFSGLIDSGGFSQEAFDKRFTYSSIYRLFKASELLKDVQILNEDYSSQLNNEGSNVFIYLDPPYFDFKKSKLYGENGSIHKQFNFNKFVENVSSCKHNWLISYNYSEEVVNAFKDFSNIYKINLTYGMRNAGVQEKKSFEVLITNFEPYNEKTKNLKIN